MRRGNRQKLICGDEQDWCHRWARRAYRLTRKPGIGKYNKRKLAKRRRREARRSSERDDSEEETLVTPIASFDYWRRRIGLPLVLASLTFKIDGDRDVPSGHEHIVGLASQLTTLRTAYRVRRR